MRLVTYTFRGTTRLGAMSGDGEVIDLARASARGTGAPVPDDMLALLQQGDGGMRAARQALAAGQEHARRSRIQALAAGVLFETREAGFQLEAPLRRPGKVLAIGLNYRDHAAESKMEIPKQPVVFSKVSSCITGPGMPIYRPRVSAALDWEGEFCFVIGRRARHVKAADALDYVAGYTVGDDVSVRDWQFHSGTWMMGKGFDTHGPLGPWIVTRDEIPDPSTSRFAPGSTASSSSIRTPTSSSSGSARLWSTSRRRSPWSPATWCSPEPRRAWARPSVRRNGSRRATPYASRSRESACSKTRWSRSPRFSSSPRLIHRSER